jgi:hypothetical protein
MAQSKSARLRVPVLPVRQWLKSWDAVDYDPKHHRRKPEPEFYLLAMDAMILRRLSGIYRRTATQSAKRADDLGIQRRHDPERSDEIARFVRFGYPWSEIPERRRRLEEYRDLRKPGWLATAVVVNILTRSDRRLDSSVSPAELVDVEDGDNDVSLLLPPGVERPDWTPSQVPPLEVIDGQHRLWAFNDEKGVEGFELPVVAFHGLDLSWQAYLFYTINIKPKKINRSLAFDLYPLLRTEDWLEEFEGPAIYRETRAQELTEALWLHPASPWQNRINMLGEGRSGVSQAAWIRALMASFVKGWEGKGVRIGGLFGAPVGSKHLALPWSRAQQAAFLILLWSDFAKAVGRTRSEWSKSIGSGGLFSMHSLVNSDQGVRAVLQVANDLVYIKALDLDLFNWQMDLPNTEALEIEDVTSALKAARAQPFAPFLSVLAERLALFDWRTASAPGLSEEHRVQKLAFRGSGGYRELRRQLLRHLISGDKILAPAAQRVASILHLK